MENESVINQRVHDFTKQIDVFQTVLVFLLSLLVPSFLAQLLQLIFGETSFVASHAQYVVGSVVNACLIMVAINFKGWPKIIIAAVVPNLSNIMGGLIFPAVTTPYLPYMSVAIWLGNLALIMAYKLIMLKGQKNYFLAGAVGIVVKVAIIFGWFQLLNFIGVFPDAVAAILSISMGYIQIATAAIGLVIAFVIYKAETRAIKQKEANN